MPDTDEVFANSPLFEVAFEVRFPHLFYIAQKIGEFQLDIVDDFPKSSQVFTQSFVFGEKREVIPDKDNVNAIPSWQFENETGKTRIVVYSNKLNIISREYKSYNHPSEKKFKDLITKILSVFAKTVPMKKFSRIGIRYIDHCPLERLDNEYFKNYYNPIFNIDKYKVEDILDNLFMVNIKREQYNLLFQCGIRKLDVGYKYIMDYDGYATEIEADSCITTTDELRRLIKKEFLSNITEDFKKYMRRTP